MSALHASERTSELSHVHRLRTDALAHRRVEDETIALDLRASNYLSVNPTGSVLWEALVVGASTARLEGLLRDAGASDAEAARDVAAFLAQLRERGLLVDG